ncbi:RlmE family RNA methyltransferase, partial [Bifidobacterium adolescentis]|uniref:RlmE family RNA methyltransferase n=1 Tax=Bifidobacterium adolescentis TaxID=1680 RepID=UPI001EDCF5AB
GAAPGGWSQVAAKRVKSEDGKGRDKGKVVGIDLLDIDAIPGVQFEVFDFLDDKAPARLREMLDGPADAVLSDMAANATGHRQTDHLKIVAL